jgi:NADPH-dependent glutamate synthase beta subunit-like oxidoreductase
VARLSLSPKSPTDALLTEYLESYTRRVLTTPPGVCPLAVQLALLQTAVSQTCGKCVPCRDGLPQLEALFGQVVACQADETTLEQIKTLAEMVQNTSDCAIGYEAARVLLKSMVTFADEYQSHIEHKRCTQNIEQTVPCETMCPAHVDVPTYIALVGEGDYAGAVNTVRKDNPFPTACAFVCEHPCEAKCRRMLIDAPLNIRGIKRYAVDQASADSVLTPKRNPETGRSVAIIGGGPSGLTCAYFLARMGHNVTVFEAHKKLGGMLRYGIPAYRFPRERLDEDIRGILAVGGIDVKCGISVGSAEIREIATQYDAVYVSIGAHAGKPLNIPGSDAKGVYSAVELLAAIGDDEYPDFTDKRVIVIGGGNVAMDCARTAMRSGAKSVGIAYRRRKEDMTALAAEVESAIAEGVDMLLLLSPLSIETNEQGRCTAFLAQPQMIGPIKDGRPLPVDANKEPLRIPADIILMAVGQDIITKPFEKFGMKANRGAFVADEHLKADGVDGIENVYVGGDCQTRPATVIKAIGAGRVAARNIDEYLGYHHKLTFDIESPELRENDRTPMGRVELVERPAHIRKHDFEDVELGMSREEVEQECRRCLRCDHYGCGAQEGGREQYA